MSVSVIYPIPEKLLYSSQKLEQMFHTILHQTRLPEAIYILNQQDNDILSSSLFDLANRVKIHCEIIPAQNQFLTACAHVLAKMQTSHFIFIQNESAPLYFRTAALQLFSMVVSRKPAAGLFYFDYELLEPDGARKEIHLNQFHPGRLRDNMDFGRVFLVRTDIARKLGGFAVKYPNGYFYDFRLRLSAKSELILISNRFYGSAYTVEETPKAHNVFDYLQSSKGIQREMEQILTDHLQRIRAYLAPGNYQRTITYSESEEARFKNCIASVVIPVHNRQEFIGIAIESVLQQSIRQVEVIVVVNGGHNDPTIEAVKMYQPGGSKYNPNMPDVRLIVLDINNIGFCLNEGIKIARGKYYVQLDSDDRLKQDAVEKLLAVFNSDPHIAMVIGSYEVWQKEDDGSFFRRSDIPVVTHNEWTEENGRNNLLRINGAGAPRAAHIKVIKEMGWFSMNDIPYSRNYGEDYEMVLKISEKYRIGRVWEPVYEVVRHSGGTDHSIDQQTIDRNDNAKDTMRLQAIERRIKLNRKRKKIDAVRR